MESIDITDRTFEFAKRIIRLCQNLNEKGRVSRTLQIQLLQSGTSIGANDKEAQTFFAETQNKLLSAAIEPDDFQDVPFHQRGGLAKARKLFGNEFDPIIEELNTLLVV